MKNFIGEFKEFAVKGNVIDLAVGVIIGAGFGKIVTSLVNDIIMPPLGLLLGGADFSDKQWVLKEAVGDSPAVIINWGIFINSIVDFLIISLVIFVVIKQINRLKRKEEQKDEVKHPTEIEVLQEIRDELRRK